MVGTGARSERSTRDVCQTKMNMYTCRNREDVMNTQTQNLTHRERDRSHCITKKNDVATCRELKSRISRVS